MEKKSSYAGKISHGGVQSVKAPFGKGESTKGGKVIKGEDLRTGKK